MSIITGPPENRPYTDADIKDQSINTIRQLNHLKRGFKLTPQCLDDAYEENDQKKFKYLTDVFGFNMKGGLCNKFIDIAIEDGNKDMAEFMAREYQCQPSLYAKQMAHINGHHALSFWADTYLTQRSNTDIKTVHHSYKTGWSAYVPEEFRY